jgi:hypothetical protein
MSHHHTYYVTSSYILYKGALESTFENPCLPLSAYTESVKLFYSTFTQYVLLLKNMFSCKTNLPLSAYTESVRFM